MTPPVRLRPALFGFAFAGWVALAAWRGGCFEPPRPPPAERWSVAPEEVEVLDGDTYRVRGRRVRLLGADTPERAAPWFRGDQEPWGSRAAARVRRALDGGRRVTLLTRGRVDARERLLAHLVVDGEPLAALLVREGLACPTLVRFGDGGFPVEAARVEAAAQSRRGALPFRTPWRWRREHRREAP